MKNFRVAVTDNNTIVVRADSTRYGRDAIVYEGHTFLQCFDYIRRTSGKSHFQIKHLSTVAPFTDAEGRTMGRSMWIEFPA